MPKIFVFLRVGMNFVCPHTPFFTPPRYKQKLRRAYKKDQKHKTKGGIIFFGNFGECSLPPKEKCKSNMDSEHTSAKKKKICVTYFFFFDAVVSLYYVRFFFHTNFSCPCVFRSAGFFVFMRLKKRGQKQNKKQKKRCACGSLFRFLFLKIVSFSTKKTTKTNLGRCFYFFVTKNDRNVSWWRNQIKNKFTI